MTNLEDFEGEVAVLVDDAVSLPLQLHDDAALFLGLATEAHDLLPHVAVRLLVQTHQVRLLLRRVHLHTAQHPYHLVTASPLTNLVCQSLG